MINVLNDVSIRTMIGQLPRIINKNNDIIEQNFDNIYDSSLNKIIKPVDTTQNSQDGNYVKSQTGNFLNVICDNIVANKITVQDIIIEGEIKSEQINSHNSLKNRYQYKDIRTGSIQTINSTTNKTLNKFAHNAGSIGIGFGGGHTQENKEGSSVDVSIFSLQEVINDIINGNVQKYRSFRHYDTKLDKQYDEQGRPIPKDEPNPETGQIEYLEQYYNRESYVALYGSSNPNNPQEIEEPNSFTFENNVLFATNVQLKRMNLPKYQYDDIKMGNIYTYYDYAPIITINDEHSSSLKGVPGARVHLKFNDLKKKAYYRIILSRKDKKYLRISKDELLRLNLICLSTDDTYGSIWDVDTYCVRHPEDLIIEKK